MRIVVGYTLLALTMVAVVILARRCAAAQRRITDLEARLEEATEAEEVLRRAGRPTRRRRRDGGHLHLLALLPPVAWVAANVGRRHVAVAAAAASAVFTAGAIHPGHDSRRYPRADAATPVTVDLPPPGPPIATIAVRPTPTSTTTSTTATTAPPSTTTTTAPAATTTTTQPPAPAPTTTTTTAPAVSVDTTVLGPDCPLDVDGALLGGLAGLDVSLCPAGG